MHLLSRHPLLIARLPGLWTASLPDSSQPLINRFIAAHSRNRSWITPNSDQSLISKGRFIYWPPSTNSNISRTSRQWDTPVVANDGTDGVPRGNRAVHYGGWRRE